MTSLLIFLSMVLLGGILCSFVWGWSDPARVGGRVGDGKSSSAANDRDDRLHRIRNKHEADFDAGKLTSEECSKFCREPDERNEG